MDFFLENGAINIKLTSGEGDSATGTANNDIYQRIRDKQNELNQQMNAIYQSMSDTALTDEQREAKAKQMNDLEEQYIATAKEGIKQTSITQWEYSCSRRTIITWMWKNSIR